MMIILLTLMCIPVCAFLWAFAGANGTSLGWRRLGLGIYLSGLSWAITGDILGFAVIPALFAATCIGYGRPGSSDEGSPLGRFWFSLLRRPTENRFNQSEITVRYVDLFIRFTVACLYALALLPLAYIGSLTRWEIATCFLITNQLIFTVFFKPNKMILGKYNLEEAIVGAGVGLAGLLCLL